jgi:hypothetical protein
MEEEKQHKFIGYLTIARGWIELGLMSDQEQELKNCLKMSLEAIDKLIALFRTKE